jgi:hypothetical protein
MSSSGAADALSMTRRVFYWFGGGLFLVLTVAFHYLLYISPNPTLARIILIALGILVTAAAADLIKQSWPSKSAMSRTIY